MALTIETGTGVANANSFATVTECRDYATQRGLELPTNDSDVEALLIKAQDYLQSLEGNFQGSRTHTIQELAFPREGVVLFGVEQQKESIPKLLKTAQCRLAFDASQADLLTTGGGRIIKKEQVGPLVTEYDNDGVANPQVKLTQALAHLDPLFKSNASVKGRININVDR